MLEGVTKSKIDIKTVSNSIKNNIYPFETPKRLLKQSTREQYQPKVFFKLSYLYYIIWVNSVKSIHMTLTKNNVHCQIYKLRTITGKKRHLCSRYYPLGIAPIVFSFDLLHISYLRLGNSCSQTFDEDSRIFCRSRPSWHSATWPLV